jgi:hypothetical protein
MESVSQSVRVRVGEAAHSDARHPCISPTDSDKDVDTVRTGQKITTENSDRFLQYEDGFGVLICAVHGYAVRDLAYHFQKYHTGSGKEKSAVVKKLEHYQLREPKAVLLPSLLGVPFESLRKPKKAYICDEPECEKISINRNGIRIHCNIDHEWKSTEAEREHWHEVWVQTFFSAAGLQRYFTVDYGESEDDAQSA